MSREPANGWRPIEAAPKDGFPILLWIPERCYCAYWSEYLGGSWIIAAPGLPVLEGDPTHWQPLPKDPTDGPSEP